MISPFRTLRSIERQASERQPRHAAPAGLTGLAGMGAAYYPFVSEMTAIVSVAQLAQALLYRYDNRTREQSNNLWMRKIVIVSHNSGARGRDIHVGPGAPR